MDLEKCDFYTIHDLKSLLKNIKNEFPIVLTPHKSQSSDILYAIEVFKKTSEGCLKLTPKDFLKSKHKFLNISKDSEGLSQLTIFSHLIVEDYDLMTVFGYGESLNKIKKFGYNFIYIKSNTMKHLSHLNFNKFSINCNETDYYYYVYLLYTKHTSKMVIICKNYKKMCLFCKTLNIECVVDTTYKDEYFNKICVVVEEFKEVENIVIYIGLDYNGKTPTITENNKIKYRIGDLVKCLTKDVVNGKRKLNVSRFKDIYRK